MDAHNITYPSSYFDTVVSTFSLCSVNDPKRVLNEMQRVCKEDGTILLLEHGKSKWIWLNRILDRGVDKHVQEWGCRWNKDILQLIKEAGMDVIKINRWHFGTTYYIIAKPSDKVTKLGLLKQRGTIEDKY